MAETTDMAPTRRRANGAARSRSRSNRASSDQLEAQVKELQDDLRAIAETLTKLTNQKVSEVRGTATSQVSNLLNAGKDAVDQTGDQVHALERQIKTMIRDKPLTAVGSAIGIGFILALMARL